MFTPAKLGPVTLRNRIIKAATFEASTPNALVTDDLITYHRLPAAGGVGMTTVAYLAVSPGGRTEGWQIWWRPEAVPGLRRLTDAIHAEGAAISAQIGHAGPVANARSNKAKAYAPVRFFNPLSMRFAKKATRDDIDDIIDGARQRGAVRDRSRLRRRRDPPRPQLFRQLVPQPADQPARRRIRRVAGEPRQGGARHGDGGAARGGAGGTRSR